MKRGFGAAVAAMVVMVSGLQVSAAPVAAGVRLAPVAPQVVAPRVTGRRPPVALARPQWLAAMSGEEVFKLKFGQAFDALDANGDGKLTWAVVDSQGKLHADQAGTEPLPASYDSCYLIDYLHHPASTEKDPAHPGQYVQTPESYEITGWKTWKEALAQVDSAGFPAMSSTGICNKTGPKQYCHHKNGYEEPLTCAFGACNCHPAEGDSIVTKDVCLEPQTVPAAFTKDAWLKLASDHFKREDWNHDGKLDADESAEYVCAAGS